MPLSRYRKAGLEITTRAIKYAKVEKRRNTYRVIDSVKLDIASLADKMEALETLRRNKITARDKLILAYPPNVYTTEAIFPRLSDRELRHAIELNADKYLAKPVEEIIYDFKVVDQVVEDHIAKQRVLILSFNKTELENELSTLSAARILPYKLSDASFALFNLASLSTTLPERVLLVNIDMDYITMVFLRNKKLWMSRTIPLGVANLLENLRLTVSLPEGKVVVIDHDRAVQLLNEYGIPESTDKSTEEGIPLSMLRSFHRPFLEKLINELKRTLQYISSALKEKVEAIFLIGEGATIKNLLKNIAEEIDIRCELMDPGEFFETPDDRPLYEFAIPLGLALDFENVNLLPSALKLEWHARQQRSIVQLIGALLIPSLVAIYGLLHLQEVLLKERKTFLSYEYATMKKKATEFFNLVEERNRLLNRKAHLPQVVQTSLLIDILKELSALTPRNIQLNKVDLNKNEILISGVVFGDEAELELHLSEFLFKLNYSPHIGNLEVLNKSKVMLSNNAGLRFEIKGTVR